MSTAGGVPSLPGGSLTVLTRAAWSERGLALALATARLRPILRQLRTRRELLGQRSRLQSLFRGLDRLGVRYRYNPFFTRSVRGTVLVHHGGNALLQTVALRTRGRIRRLVAGPVVFSHPDEFGGLALDPAIDAHVVAGPWMRDYFLSVYPQLAGRVHLAPAGVDTEAFRRAGPPAGTTRNVLLYVKPIVDRHGIRALAGEVRHVLEGLGLRFEVLEYGRYTAPEYARALDRSDLAVFLTESETQGIAFAEAWSMEVPTLVLDRRGNVLKGSFRRRCELSRTCPYLSDLTGLHWDDPAGLRRILREYALDPAGWVSRFSPRSWVLGNLTDRIAALRLLEACAAPGPRPGPALPAEGATGGPPGPPPAGD